MVEQYMRSLKLGAMAKRWREVTFTSPEQYVCELMELELKEREANRINRLVKTAGFNVIKTLEDFVWTGSIELPNGLDREYMESLQFIPAKENLIFLGAVGTGKKVGDLSHSRSSPLKFNPAYAPSGRGDRDFGAVPGKFPKKTVAIRPPPHYNAR